MDYKLIKSLAFGATLVCSNAFAAFDGDYDVANWTSALGTGSIDVLGAPLDISLTGGDDLSGDPTSTIFSIAITTTGTLSFDWSYSSNEANSIWDPFGYELAGVVTKLTTDGVAAGANQSGSVSIAVTAGQIFGFRQTSLDNLFGSATTTVSNFSAPSPVPVPAAFGLFGFAIGGLAMTQRREKK